MAPAGSRPRSADRWATGACRTFPETRCAWKSSIARPSPAGETQPAAAPPAAPLPLPSQAPAVAQPRASTATFADQARTGTVAAHQQTSASTAPLKAFIGDRENRRMMKGGGVRGHRPSATVKYPPGHASPNPPPAVNFLGTSLRGCGRVADAATRPGNRGINHRWTQMNTDPDGAETVPLRRVQSQLDLGRLELLTPPGRAIDGWICSEPSVSLSLETLSFLRGFPMPRGVGKRLSPLLATHSFGCGAAALRSLARSPCPLCPTASFSFSGPAQSRNDRPARTSGRNAAAPRAPAASQARRTAPHPGP